MRKNKKRGSGGELLYFPPFFLLSSTFNPHPTHPTLPPAQYPLPISLICSPFLTTKLHLPSPHPTICKIKKTQHLPTHTFSPRRQISPFPPINHLTTTTFWCTVPRLLIQSWQSVLNCANGDNVRFGNAKNNVVVLVVIIVFLHSKPFTTQPHPHPFLRGPTPLRRDLAFYFNEECPNQILDTSSTSKSKKPKDTKHPFHQS